MFCLYILWKIHFLQDFFRLDSTASKFITITFSREKMYMPIRICLDFSVHFADSHTSVDALQP